MNQDEFFAAVADIFLGEWRDYANCIGSDPDLWANPDREEDAAVVCNSCAVQLECLDNAIAMEDDYDYRAFSEKARKKIKRHRSRYNKQFEYDLRQAGILESQVQIL